MGGVARSHGFGDVFFRAKVNFIGNDSGDLAIAAIPYIKVPSQVALISNGATEAGVIIPIQYKLPSDFVLLIDPEFDALKNAANNGRHANFVNLINLSHPVPGIKDLTAEVEFFSSVSAERLSPDIYTGGFRACLSRQPEAAAGPRIERRPQRGGTRPPGVLRNLLPLLRRSDARGRADCVAGGQPALVRAGRSCP